MDIWAQQRRLAALGYHPGTIDGAWGPNTRAAVKQFQARNGLLVDGIVGDKTAAAMKSSEAKGPNGLVVGTPAVITTSIAMPPWYLEAKRLMGVRETIGPQHNTVIMNWAVKLGIWYPDDETPWCGLFVAQCMTVGVPGEPLPVNPLGARNWLKYGRALQSPVVGAILVFSRPGSSWSGHVGFYAGEDATTYSVLGGNQSNSVSVTRLAKNRLLPGGIRWPKLIDVFGSKATGSASAISTNEH